MSVYMLRTTYSVLSPLDDNPSWDAVFLAQPGFIDVPTLLSAWATAQTTNLTGQIHDLTSYLGKQVSRVSNSATIEAYDITTVLNGDPHGSPVAVHSFTPTAAQTDNGMPSGVAAAVSFRSNYGSAVEFGPGTRPRSRLRNRFYLGPLVSSAFDQEATTNRVQFTSTTMQDLTLFVAGAAQQSPGTLDMAKLQTWSRKNATTEDVIEAWMDDRPDYQRRRSDPSTVRVVNTVTELSP